ncbi:MAG: endopeptidase La [Calditrichaeota bacterium]|nr:endopeptidase La [Calditrichota bacterium]
MPRKRIVKSEPEETTRQQPPARVPVLPLRDMIFLPGMVMPLVVGRAGTMRAVEEAMAGDRFIALIAQRDTQTETPGGADLYRVGVIGRVAQLMKLPNGLAKVLIEGLQRIRVNRYYQESQAIYAALTILNDEVNLTPPIEAAMRHLGSQFKEFIQLSRHLPDELASTVDQIDAPRRLADFVVMQLNRTSKEKQKFLEIDSVYDLLVLLAAEVHHEIEILNLEQNIEGKVKDKISKSQRNYYLQEQLRAIKKELGEDGEDDLSDVLEYKRLVKRARMPKDARLKAEEEIKRLEVTPMLSPEATVIRTYLDWLIGVPWHKTTEDNRDIAAANEILDADHYGLEKPKERILEHLSVLARSEGRLRGPILCLIGPPGVGKTSLGKSVARALGRNFVRVSLGGVRDEAEIRGHRRTYIGALPGRIVQSMKKAGSMNPVFLLDEIDKMSTDFRGDPSSALLEVLDPEQNRAFSDHYLEVDYDLSQVLFITTANTRDAIPWPLLDRMETIALPGYLHQEKFEIARRFLIGKQMLECGLKEGEVHLTDAALNTIIERYTREAGVRELERSIAKVMRKATRELLEGVKPKSKGKRQKTDRDSGVERLVVDVKVVTRYLGVPPYEDREIEGTPRIGAAVGLAWTPTGGDIMTIEAESMRGKGTLTLTGMLGEVMQESARAALTAVRARANQIGFDSDLFLRQEIHVHIPEGAVPKDGPSAGITMAVALASILARRPVRGDIAMTGEITLRGDVLPIGGLREKLMAALRAGIRTVIIPSRNKRELSEVPEAVRKPLNIIPVSRFDEVIEHLLLPAEGRPTRSARSPAPTPSATVQ